MQALVKTKKGVGQIELRDVPKPKIEEDDQVLIEVGATGVCGTDIHIKHDRFPYWPPVTLGHEFAGTIVEVGPAVENFRVGDHVVAEPHTRACGRCYLCRTGNIQICAAKRSPGWGINGAFAKYLTMPEQLLHKVPDEMPWHVAAVVEPAANAVADVIERGRVEPNDFVVITGPGPIGLLAGMAARAAGAGRVMIIGTAADEAIRLPKAREIGFDYVLSLADANPREMVADVTGGRGADLVVECSGAQPAIHLCVDLVRKKGRFSQIGMSSGETVQFPWNQATSKVIDLYFNLSTTYTSWDRTIGLIADGKMPVETIVTHREPLADWERVFTEVEELRAIKGMLIP